jgi:hypothetical protein
MALAFQDEIQQPNFYSLLRKFLYYQLHSDSDSDTVSDIPPNRLPEFYWKLSIYPSAVATFFAPSDICGVGGMRRERIRAVSSWRRGPPRYDCVFVHTDPLAEGMRALDVARVRAFFSFVSQGITYPCALVHWFSRVGDEADEDTGMWVVEPDMDETGSPIADIIHLDTILRAAHLMGVSGEAFVPKTLTPDNSLDLFYSFYVNKFIDHHAFEIAF